MPLLDLQQHLKQELLNNPFLDMVEPEEDEEEGEESGDEVVEGEAETETKPEEEKAANDEIDWEEILLDGSMRADAAKNTKSASTTNPSRSTVAISPII